MLRRATTALAGGLTSVVLIAAIGPVEQGDASKGQELTPEKVQEMVARASNARNFSSHNFRAKRTVMTPKTNLLEGRCGPSYFFKSYFDRGDKKWAPVEYCSGDRNANRVEPDDNFYKPKLERITDELADAANVDEETLGDPFKLIATRKRAYARFERPTTPPEGLPVKRITLNRNGSTGVATYDHP